MTHIPDPTQYPADLYIPPHALHVHLDAFEGPLDFLLYLIKRESIDILNISLIELIDQYVVYVRELDRQHFELSFAYLSMAGFLVYLKSRMLLPPDPTIPAEEVGEEEPDPRQALIAQLERYARIQAASRDLDNRPRVGREFFRVGCMVPPPPDAYHPPVRAQVSDLVAAWKRIHNQRKIQQPHTIQSPSWSFEQQWDWADRILKAHRKTVFSAFVIRSHGMISCAWALVVLLELCKQQRIDLHQETMEDPLEVWPHQAPEASDQEEMADAAYEDAALLV